jgi:hypothetical protein
MISQFFVLSMRGDSIIHKDCKNKEGPLFIFNLVKHDISIGKYNTTQELFLAKVGVQTSFTDESDAKVEPFFVSTILFLASSLKILFAGKIRSPVHLHQEKSVVLCIHVHEKNLKRRGGSRTPQENSAGKILAYS